MQFAPHVQGVEVVQVEATQATVFAVRMIRVSFGGGQHYEQLAARRRQQIAAMASHVGA